jgi:orotate phosphoribosyltransferase
MIVARQELLAMLAEKSFRLGEFKLSSGGTSDYYIDCRATTLDADGARLTGRTFVDELYRRGWTPQAIGGITLGADPIVVAVAMLTAQQVQLRRPRNEDPDSPEAWLIHAFIVRKGEKGHGTGQRIEGFRQKGARVVIVDDVCTTGASTVEAIRAARDFGFEVIGVMCLVEREDAGGRPNVERAAAPAPFLSIFTAREIREEHLRLKQALEPRG